MYETNFFFHEDLQKALPSMVFMLGVISFVVVGIILPSMPRFYGTLSVVAADLVRVAAFAVALDSPLLVLLLVCRIKFAEPPEHCLGPLPGCVRASLSPLAVDLCRRISKDLWLQ